MRLIHRSMPRYQLSRSRKLPEGVRSVARPTKWGNPFKVGGPLTILPSPGVDLRMGGSLMVMEPNAKLAVILHRAWLRVILVEEPDYLDDLQHASGLACWCPIGEPCHAETLIDAIDSRLGHNDPNP